MRLQILSLILDT